MDFKVQNVKLEFKILVLIIRVIMEGLVYLLTIIIFNVLVPLNSLAKFVKLVIFNNIFKFFYNF